jgi:predicted metal-dependent phosphoesterase TrpH
VTTSLVPSFEVVLADRVFGAAGYRYLPFDVPPGVTKLDLAVQVGRGAVIGIGLFDPRGHGYGSQGFRGMAGAERREIFVGLREATPGFVPGPLPAGRWTVIMPVYVAVLPTLVTVRIRMEQGPPSHVSKPGPLPGVVRAEPGWYRGDLHCHTVASTDAWATGAALSTSGWADQARELGLDFLALTDHNVVSQNHDLARDAGRGVLLLAGEEVTSPIHGHATVCGIEADQWLDFRVTPRWLPRLREGGRIEELVAAARDAGGYIAAAHPTTPLMSWQFLADGLTRPGARPDGLEVWNGRWNRLNELSLRLWHRLLCAGWQVVANGGSDLHGLDTEVGLGPGTPTTIAYASELGRSALVETVRAGRSFVTARPDGVEIYLTARSPHGQETFTGGRIQAPEGTAVAVRALVRGAGGMRLTLVHRAGTLATAAVRSDEEIVEACLPLGSGDDFVRAEVRRGQGLRTPAVLPARMEALTNPIWLIEGPVPTRWLSEFAPAPQRRRRATWGGTG